MCASVKLFQWNCRWQFCWDRGVYYNWEHILNHEQNQRFVYVRNVFALQLMTSSSKSIKFLEDNDLTNVINGYERLRGAIDGTHISITAPCEHHADYRCLGSRYFR